MIRILQVKVIDMLIGGLSTDLWGFESRREFLEVLGVDHQKLTVEGVGLKQALVGVVAVLRDVLLVLYQRQTLRQLR